MKLHSTPLLVLLVASLGIVCIAGELKIAAFNIQIFGTAKMENEAAVDTIVDIVRRYHLILIQEIRDASGEAIVELLTRLNEHETYSMIISDRLGRTKSKEQYAYLFRENVLSITEEYQYPEALDQFERPPYCVKVETKESDLRTFWLVGVHTSPDKAVEEINALKEVHDVLIRDKGAEDVMIMGDLNAGCSYVTRKQLPHLAIRSSEYHWLIGDTVDTTVSGTSCPYDRFIVSGNRFREAIVPGSARVFNYWEYYSLTEEQAKDVSDHFPIEFSLKTSTSSALSSGTKATGMLIEATQWLLSRMEL